MTDPARRAGTVHGEDDGCQGGPEGVDMASKDKGGRSSKTAAAKTPREKRDDKRAKKQAKVRDDRAG